MVAQQIMAVKSAMRQDLSTVAYFDAKYENTHTARLVSPEYTLQRNMQRAKPAQTRRIRHAKPVKISVYADMIKATLPDEMNGVNARDTTYSGGGIRGNIAGFSRASRKRMIEFMARIRDVGDMYFVTMTYDDWSWLKKHNDHHDDFEAFRHRFERAFPNWKAIWRVEVKERLSGMLTGSKVPHFHLLVFTGRNDDDETKKAHAEGLRVWGVQNWGEIIQPESQYFDDYGFHVSSVRSRKHAYSYVGKYIGKQDDDNISCGRRWGRIGKFDCSCSETILLSDDETIELKRLVRKWLKSKKAKFASKFAKLSPAKGCTVFGLGDTDSDGILHGLFSPLSQFIVETKRISYEKQARERGYSD